MKEIFRSTLAVISLVFIPFISFAGVTNNSDVFKKRAADWRNGAVVYQVFVDRFAPSSDLATKQNLYAPPKRLLGWNELPKAGGYVEEAGVWRHEIDFWGGDLKSLNSKLDYLKNLGVDIVYLNPIFSAQTNHKYDTWDYMQVDPMYGTNADLVTLAKDIHQNGMKLVLDGVFNHMGKSSPMFQQALESKSSKWREYFRFSGKSEMGYVAWVDVPNLPALNLENKKVRDWLFLSPDSVMQHYLKKVGIDGWRLDASYEFGYKFLDEMTKSSHLAKPGSLVIAEQWNYPAGWFPFVDATVNFHLRQIILSMLQGKLNSNEAGRMVDKMISDAGIENILMSWNVLDNHDTPRLVNLIKDPKKRELAQILQFVFPGCPYIYYGAELGMEGGDDPTNRASMKWDMVNDSNGELNFVKKLIALQSKEPALRYGDYVALESQNSLAFTRATDKIREVIVIVVNPTDKKVKDFIQLRDGRFQDWTKMKDLLSNFETFAHAGTLDIEIPANTVLILKPVIETTPKGYNRYFRLF